MLHRMFRVLGFLLLVLIGGLVLRYLYTFRDRNPGYTVALNIDGQAGRTLKPLRAGFARVKISPDLSNTNEPIWLAGSD